MLRTRVSPAFTRHPITTDDASIGSALSPNQIAEYYIDRLSASSICLESGWTQLRTNRESIRIPHMTDDVTAAWVAELDPIPESDPTGDPIIATPKKLAALTSLSNEVRADSLPQIIDLTGNSMERALRLTLDLGLLEGTGVAPQIRGLKNVAGISEVSMGANGATPTNLDPWADAIGTLAENDSEATAIYMTPREWRTILKIKEDGSSNLPIVNIKEGPDGKPMRSIYGVRVWLSSQMSLVETQGTSTDTSSSYVVQADQQMIVWRDEAQVALSDSSKFNVDGAQLRATLRADAVYPHPASIVRIRGLRNV